jgi:cysteine dioxygenase
MDRKVDSITVADTGKVLEGRCTNSDGTVSVKSCSLADLQADVQTKLKLDVQAYTQHEQANPKLNNLDKVDSATSKQDMKDTKQQALDAETSSATCDAPEDKISLAELVQGLTDTLSEGKDMNRVRQLMESYDYELNEWRRFAFWDEKCNYTRNLVATDNRTFTLMVLCWNAHKSSPVHDHAGSECFMKIIKGELVEHRYHMPDPQQPDLPLRTMKSTSFKSGSVAFINDTIGLHKMGNESSTPAASLHCYMPPFESCHAFCNPDKSARSSEVHVCFYSEGGQKIKH